mgnify:CR=1 FL=1
MIFIRYHRCAGKEKFFFLAYFLVFLLLLISKARPGPTKRFFFESKMQTDVVSSENIVLVPDAFVQTINELANNIRLSETPFQ